MGDIMSKCRPNLQFLLLFLALSAGIIVITVWEPFLTKADEEVSMPKSTEWNGNFTDGWRQFDQLTKEQKYEAASALAEKMLAEAKTAGPDEEWVRCLIRYTQLRIALHGYETAVRFLKEQPWPNDQLGGIVLDLFYAQSLVNYATAYSWEINQREKVESRSVVDLKAWTKDQIYDEAQKAFAEAWNHREFLSQWPVSRWKEFMTPNNYPAGIRPTLRDAVSYLWVEMLSNTSGWRPEHLNEIFRLNLKSLLNGSAPLNSGMEQAAMLANPAIHPLDKMCALLGDLENWHNQRGEREAALEARLERTRQLHMSFTQADDRELITQDLIAHLNPLPDVPWWSAGMAQLAEFIKDEDKPDALVRARGKALEGYKAFPDSVGGKQCLALQTSIEGPDYELQGMIDDNPQKKSILLLHKNLGKIYFRAYAYNLQRYIESSNDYHFFPTWDELNKTMRNLVPAQEWEVPLPPTPDYRMHKTFVIPPMSKPGAYLVTASARPGFPESNNKLLGLHTIVGNLVLVTRQEAGAVQVTLLDGAEGKPVRGVEVILYQQNWRNPHKAVETQISDDKGVVRFERTDQENGYLLFAKKGDQYAVDPQRLYLYRQSPPGRQLATLLFTDRSIYRPSQKILWKAVLYQGSTEEARFDTMPAQTVTISLMDINQQVVEFKPVTTNSFGTVSGEFTIPAGRALGHWSLVSSLNGQTPVQVEEYKRPTFEAKLLDPEEPLRLNKAAALKGEARYYFGLPVTTGTVKWSVRREPVFPWWWSYYWSGGFSGRSSETQIIASGTVPLDENGKFIISFTPEIDERLGKDKDLTYRYSISADITDEGGKHGQPSAVFGLGLSPWRPVPCWIKISS